MSCALQAQYPEEIELALWFHDAIYNPLSGKNEQKSAAWASSFLHTNDASPEAIERIHQLIMVTGHNVKTSRKDESLLVDVDLSILGADARTYDEFEGAVRREYRMIPMFIYRKKRAELLNRFLQRPQIFENEPFLSEREHQAKMNLSNAVTQLVGCKKKQLSQS